MIAGMAIQIVATDITTLKVDAIVNAANAALCGGGGVDGAIHRAAGDKLLAECRTLKGCKAGHAKLTKGYDLPASYVIHAVGPVWYGGANNEALLLVSCYQECLKIANDYNLKSIAFPAISCGAYRFPIPQACDIAMNKVVSVLKQKNTSVEAVIFACFEGKVKRALENSFSKFL